MPHYRNKTVVITGACGGIGRALAARFGEAGARIALIDIREEQLAALAEHLESRNIQAQGYLCDIRDPQQVEQTFSLIVSDFCSIDVLINNAGIVHHSRFEETSLSVFHKMMETNYFGALHCVRSALQQLIANKGQIITMSSTTGVAPLWYRSACAASKHALHGLFDCVRVELREKGVRVMMVCPGFTATDMYKNVLQADGSVSSNPVEMKGKATAPNDVAEEIYHAARKDKRLLVMSNVDWRARFIARVLPGFFERHLAHRLTGVIQTY